jgi:geranylgeranyl pyrophosphate synthase
MKREEVKAIVLNLPEVAAWPELSDIFSQAVDHPRQDWELPLLASRAVGGDDSLIPLAGAALICIQLSITVVDDILDQDPRGVHHRIGAGAAANVALALQAAALRLVDDIPVEATRRAAVNRSLAQMALGTAFGQNLDVQNLEGEENYWRVVAAKSTPFYGAALHVGALLGQATPKVAEQVREFGKLNGEIIQLYDDLTDALKQPANPDWKRVNNNLALLYATRADYPEREQFLALLPQADDPAALHSAQQILIRSGAVGYCAYHIVQRYKRARQILAETPLADPEPLSEMLAHQIQPVLTLLRHVGAPIPPELETV